MAGYEAVMGEVGTKQQCIDKLSLVFRFKKESQNQSFLITTPGTSATRLSRTLLVSHSFAWVVRLCAERLVTRLCFCATHGTQLSSLRRWQALCHERDSRAVCTSSGRATKVHSSVSTILPERSHNWVLPRRTFSPRLSSSSLLLHIKNFLVEK